MSDVQPFSAANCKADVQELQKDVRLHIILVLISVCEGSRVGFKANDAASCIRLAESDIAAIRNESYQSSFAM